MYNRDNKMIQKYTDQGSTQTAMAAMFAITSIKTNTWLLPDMIDNYRDGGIKTLNNLMGMQREGIKYVMKNKEWLYNLVQSYKAGDIYPEELLLSLQRIPCIGLVKAGFIMQLTTGEAGCFDCHNLKEYDLNENTFKINSKDKGKITAANFNKARKYLAVCKEIGGSEVLWNNWCDLIAAKYPKHFEAGDDVSWLHSNAIMGIHQTIARAQTMTSEAISIEPNMYQAIALKHGLRLWIKHGIKANTRWTVTNMLRTVGKFTGKSYKRSKQGQEEGLADIIAVIENWKQHETTMQSL